MTTRSYLFIALRISVFVASFVMFWAFNPMIITVVAWDLPTIILIGELELISIFLMLWAGNPKRLAWMLKGVAALFILFSVSEIYFLLFW